MPWPGDALRVGVALGPGQPAAGRPPAGAKSGGTSQLERRGRGGVVGRAEAPMDVVVDDADVLQERVHARGPDEAVPLRLQLLGELLRLRRRLGQIGNGPRCPPAGDLVGLREHHEAWRRGHHRAGVVDGGLDLATVADDRGVLDQPVHVPVRRRRDLGDVEAPECVPLPEHDRPAQPDLEHSEGERLEHRGLVVGAGTPDFVVVAAEGGIAGAGPGAAWLAVVPDDHVAAHLSSCGCPALPAPESPRLLPSVARRTFWYPSSSPKVALETFRRLGAAPWTRRAEAELRACGVTTAAAPTAADAAAGLTAQQREIVILANGGLTNSQIADRLALSLRTAASHPTCIPRIGRSASARPGC